MKQNFLYKFIKQNNITKPTFIGYFIAIAVVLYFSSFTIFGEKGLIKLFILKQQIAEKSSLKHELNSKAAVKKNMVEGMKPESLDIDLLDEQARRVLGYAGKNEVVVYEDKSK